MTETERIDFPDGSWWEFASVLLHGVTTKVEAAARQFLRVAEPAQYGPKDELVKTPTYEVDWTIWSPVPANNAMLLHSTAAWSFGDVNQATLDGIPQAKCEQVVQRMNELYASPLVEAAPSGRPSNSSTP